MMSCAIGGAIAAVVICRGLCQDPSNLDYPYLTIGDSPAGRLDSTFMARRLLIRPGAIGDFIVSLPALESLTQPGQYTEVWCASPNVPLARFADQARSIASTGLDRLGITHADDVIERLRSFDDIISWYGENRPEFREFVAHAGLPFRFLRALPDGKCHAVDFYNAQARELGANPQGNPHIACPDTPRTFAAIHPSASSQAKRAPMEVFQAAAAKLELTMPVHWLCGPEEELPGAIHIPDLYELARWLRGASIFVGNDSGISHLAAAVGTPVVAFFQASDPKVWAPRGTAVDVIRR
jgi:ADP-heptose:LPS heptosyltransferase